jgi:hypothetical protein
MKTIIMTSSSVTRSITIRCAIFIKFIRKSLHFSFYKLNALLNNLSDLPFRVKLINQSRYHAAQQPASPHFSVDPR